MKVLQLTQRFPPAIGGVERHVLQLASGLRAAGVEVEVFTTDLARDVPFQRLRGDVGAFSFPVSRYRAWKLLEVPHGLGIAAPSMLFDVLSSDVDLIHAHAYGHFPTWVGGLATLLNSKPVVMTPHCDPGSLKLSRRLFDHFVPPLTLKRASRIIALTWQEASYLASLGIPRERVHVIPNGVCLEEFSGIQDMRGTSPEFTILFVGRLYPRQKGLLPLIQALALLPESVGARLRLVGEDWGGAATVAKIASRLGVSGRITIVGRLSRVDLLREYASADVFVLPSLFEPFGIVLLEAMASGLPVVASRTGGIPEIVDDGRTGCLVPPGDASALAYAIRQLAEDDALRQSLGRAGRERVISYSWKSLVPRVIEVYEKAIQGC